MGIWRTWAINQKTGSILPLMRSGQRRLKSQILYEALVQSRDSL